MNEMSWFPQQAADARLHLGEIAIPLAGAGPLAGLVETLAPDWLWEEHVGEVAEIAIQEDRGGFRIDHRILGPAGGFCETAELAAGTLLGLVLACYLQRLGAHLLLHAAASRMGDGAILLLGESGAGKSSLSLHLAARGCRLWGDDRVALDLSRAKQLALRALGLGAKLRTPLPADWGDEFGRFASARIAQKEPGAWRLRLPREEQAPLGAGAALRAIVLLDRVEGAGAQLSRLESGATMAALLRSALSPDTRPAALVARLIEALPAYPRYRLTFSSSRGGAELLCSEFGATP